jgi:hypothetical protein
MRLSVTAFGRPPLRLLGAPALGIPKLTFIATAVASLAVLSPCTASAAALDIRVAWDANGGGTPNQIEGHNQALDGYNEILGAFGNGGAQVAGDDPAHLIDFNTKADTGVGVTWSGWKGTDYGNNSFSASRDWVRKDITGAMLLRNYPANDPTPGTVTFAGLANGASYKVEVVMAGFVNGAGWNVTIDGINADTTFDANDSAATRAAWSSSSNGTADRDWLIWSSATASAGTLALNFADAGTTHPIDGLAAIRITLVPEPASLGLLGIGLLLLRRRRHPDSSYPIRFSGHICLVGLCSTRRKSG